VFFFTKYYNRNLANALRCFSAMAAAFFAAGRINAFGAAWLIPRLEKLVEGLGFVGPSPSNDGRLRKS
jgi:hypothetical protein